MVTVERSCQMSKNEGVVRLLVVDDEPMVRATIRMILTLEGYAVETSDNAEDALSLFEKSRFDVVITDYSLPAMSGDRLAKAIRERVPNQPIIMITAYADHLREGGKRVAAVDYLLSKPFELPVLRALVVQALNRQ